MFSVCCALPPAAEFHSPPSCPFYETTTGALSPYGQELLPLVQFIATTGGCEPQAWAKVGSQVLFHLFTRPNTWLAVAAPTSCTDRIGVCSTPDPRSLATAHAAVPRRSLCGG